MTGADDTCAGSYRLITTLTDHRAFRADVLVRGSTTSERPSPPSLALRHTLLDGRVLRSGDRPGDGIP